jgi:hypothetical protein
VEPDALAGRQPVAFRARAIRVSGPSLLGAVIDGVSLSQASQALANIVFTLCVESPG